MPYTMPPFKVGDKVRMRVWGEAAKPGIVTFIDPFHVASVLVEYPDDRRRVWCLPWDLETVKQDN